LENLAFLIVRNHLPMHLVESQWLKKNCLHLCPRVVLPFKKTIFKRFFAKVDYMSYLLWQIVIM
jgi:hypothetical protein